MWVAMRPQPHVGGLGYWVVPPERGQGAATAAVALIVPWALDVLDLLRMEAWVQPENVASQRVLRRAGFQEEGRLRNFLTIDDRPADALVLDHCAEGLVPNRTVMPPSARSNTYITPPRPRRMRAEEGRSRGRRARMR